MFKSLILASSIILINQQLVPDANFIQLSHELQNLGFKVNIAIPPDYQLLEQKIDSNRRRFTKPYGLLNSADRSIWINPVVFELGNSNSVLIHEAVHAAQLCKGGNSLQALELDIEPISQAQPFFKRYLNPRSQILEKEAYTVQTQINSYELARNLLRHYCR